MASSIGNRQEAKTTSATDGIQRDGRLSPPYRKGVLSPFPLGEGRRGPHAARQRPMESSRVETWRGVSGEANRFSGSFVRQGIPRPVLLPFHVSRIEPIGGASGVRLERFAGIRRSDRGAGLRTRGIRLDAEAQAQAHFLIQEQIRGRGKRSSPRRVLHGQTRAGEASGRAGKPLDFGMRGYYGLVSNGARESRRIHEGSWVPFGHAQGLHLEAGRHFAFQGSSIANLALGIRSPASYQGRWPK